MKATGKISGDMECWCLDVSAEEYRRVKGEADYLFELDMRTNVGYSSDFPWRLYPSDLYAIEDAADTQADVCVEICISEVPSSS